MFLFNFDSGIGSYSKNVRVVESCIEGHQSCLLTVWDDHPLLFLYLEILFEFYSLLYSVLKKIFKVSTTK